jgi:hypothetical protein
LHGSPEPWVFKGEIAFQTQQVGSIIKAEVGEVSTAVLGGIAELLKGERAALDDERAKVSRLEELADVLEKVIFGCV